MKRRSPEKVTQERLKELLSYDSTTGLFYWKVSRRGSFGRVGALAGWEQYGYKYISIDSKNYPVHRLAWLYTFGYFPENQIDHKDRNRSNNRIDNLREVSAMCNSRNRGVMDSNTSGIVGVYFERAAMKWRARITANGVKHCLGLFETKIDAVFARWKGEVLYEFPNCCTTSSSYTYLAEKGLI